MNEKDNPNIWKEAVVGFLITRGKTLERDDKGQHYSVYMKPLIAEWESGGLEFDSDAAWLHPDSEIVGILPAPAGSAAVIGNVPKNPQGYEILGYEIPGSTVRGDWEAELRQAVKTSEEIAAEKAVQDVRDASRFQDRPDV